MSDGQKHPNNVSILVPRVSAWFLFPAMVALSVFLGSLAHWATIVLSLIVCHTSFLFRSHTSAGINWYFLSVSRSRYSVLELGSRVLFHFFLSFLKAATTYGDLGLNQALF